MDILYMGYFCNEELFDKLIEEGSKGSHARQQLEMKLLSGLIKWKGNDQLQIISYLPDVGHVQKKAGEGEVYKGISVKYLWCNKKSIASVLEAMLNNIRFIKDWGNKGKDKIIVTYSVNPIHVIPALLLRKKYNYKIITLCSEISQYRRTQKSELVSRVSRCVSRLMDTSFDGYILLSKYMNNIVNTRKKPFIIMEGIAQKFVEENFAQPKTKAILYAGGLTEDNGIKILLEGFIRLRGQCIDLWICGEGPLQDVVQEYANNYNNIIYWGVLPNHQVQQMEQQAYLLIAPRLSHNDFTRYSFPSKTIEYMSSGTPTILTRLKGIPEEYFLYAYVLEDETSLGVRNLLEKVLSEGEEKLIQMGQAAKNFVLTQKGVDVQSRKVLCFLKDQI